MRYYLIDEENSEVVVDLTQSERLSGSLVKFRFSAPGPEGKATNVETVYTRQIGNSHFVSFDGKSWENIALQKLPNHLFHGTRVFRLFRGYKPSGLSADHHGDLVTRMPGLVVKIKATVGQKVAKGDTLVILEAMKMENEIKCSHDGVVKAIHVKEGESLEEGRLLMELEAEA